MPCPEMLAEVSTQPSILEHVGVACAAGLLTASLLTVVIVIGLFLHAIVEDIRESRNCRLPAIVVAALVGWGTLTYFLYLSMMAA